MSGLGKGITTASIGRLLKDKGYKVVPIKIDPYINIDAGTMNPFQHGEVYVLKDGTEVDLDLGHYERFMDVELGREHNITTGVVYSSVIEKERIGEYLGETVQIIPHITNEIKRKVRNTAEKNEADICIVEIGGTVGDIESMPFLEAVRQMKAEEKEGDFILIHVTLVPHTVMGEQKTKPTQHSVKEHRELGLQPDVIVCRGKEVLKESIKEKIAMFCDVKKEDVISAPDVEDIYEVPLLLEQEGLSRRIMEKSRLKLKKAKKDKTWEKVVEKSRYYSSNDRKVKIGIVGKYTGMEDTYLSIKEALKHAAMEIPCGIERKWIEAENLEKEENMDIFLPDVHGILIPGGFGVRGSEGKIKAMKYARENNIPFLGLCFGFQLAVVEVARNVASIKNANSAELCETPNPVIDLLEEQYMVIDLGGTMRLGDYEVFIREGTLAERIYGKRKIKERHRHRYEVNPKYIEKIKGKNIVFSGTDRSGLRMEILEIEGHPFFLATQFHPEFKSRPTKASSLFKAFLEACLDNMRVN